MTSPMGRAEFSGVSFLRGTIAASLNPRFHIYPLRLARQCRKKGSHLFLIHIVAELLPAQDVIELGQRGKGN